MQRALFVCWRNFPQYANADFRRRRQIFGSTLTQRQLSELPLQGDDSSGALIGAGGTRSSDWPVLL